MTKIVKSDRVAQGAAHQWRVQHCQIFTAKTLMGAVLTPSETELNRPAKHVVAAQLWRVRSQGSLLVARGKCSTARVGTETTKYSKYSKRVAAQQWRQSFYSAMTRHLS